LPLSTAENNCKTPLDKSGGVFYCPIIETETEAMTFINAPMPPRADGKPRTNKEYVLQGWNAADHCVSIDDCPYYATTTPQNQTNNRHRSASE
jgi:hypothetical protein